jgi:hypothetical protein
MLERIGFALAILGGALFAAIFIVVLVSGSWPQFLDPVRERFKIISSFLGSFTFVAEVLIFLGPGGLVLMLGQWLQERSYTDRSIGRR